MSESKYLITIDHETDMAELEATDKITKACQEIQSLEDVNTVRMVGEYNDDYKLVRNK